MLVASFLLLAAGALLWLGQAPGPAAQPPAANGAQADPAPTTAGAALRVGLIPERDVFAQRRRYRTLADDLAQRLGRPVELVTVNTYQAMLDELAARRVDAAFVGSMVGALAIDRLACEPVAKPVLPDGTANYRGVLFTRGDSPLTTVPALAGRPVAMLRTTLAGNLFPAVEFQRQGVLDGPRAVRPVWLGTHDDVIRAVVEGRADAGAAKDLIVAEHARAHPESPLRWLVVSRPVPNNALIVRRDLAATLAPALRETLLAMDRDAAGRAALAAFGAARFEACAAAEFDPLYDLAGELGAAWPKVGIDGPPPKRRGDTAATTRATGS